MTLGACKPLAPAVLDASDEQRLEQSLEMILERLPHSKRQPTLRGFLRIRNTYMGHIAFRYEGETRELRQKRFDNAVAGMNAEKILAESVRIQQAWRLAELMSIRANYNHYQAAQRMLSKIQILDYAFTPVASSRNKAEFSATIRNESDQPIYSVVFGVKLHFPDGEFAQQSYLYFQMPDGISFGEKKTYSAHSLRRLDDSGEPLRQLSGFQAREAYSVPQQSRAHLIAGINVGQTPTLEGLKEAERKYRALYGQNEPEHWRANIMRELSKRNIYVGEAHGGAR